MTILKIEATITKRNVRKEKQDYIIILQHLGNSIPGYNKGAFDSSVNHLSANLTVPLSFCHTGCQQCGCRGDDLCQLRSKTLLRQQAFVQ